jgi:hypothetical protein
MLRETSFGALSSENQILHVPNLHHEGEWGGVETSWVSNLERKISAKYS